MMQATPRPHDQVVYTELDGCEAILVDLNTKRYYTLNETAMLIWQGLEQGQTKNQIVERLIDSYEVTPDAATSSVDRMLTSLAAHRLLEQ